MLLVHVHVHNNHLWQSHQQLRERLEEREGEEEVEGGKVCNSLQGRLNEVEEELESERSKVKQLEGELITTAVVKEGMERNAEKVYTCIYNTHLHIHNMDSVTCVCIFTCII